MLESMHHIHKRNQCKSWLPIIDTQTIPLFLALSFFVILILIFISTDSYLHGLYDKVDSSIFFMCGKAWMNGYIPYSDFSDSKGPLLWLIYGIGYLLSNTSYVGVFWVSCFFYSITFFYVFKCIRLFIKDRYISFVTTLGMGLFYFNICVHNIIRAEDFCQLFIILSLYATCTILYGNESNNYHIDKSSFIFGFCASCTLLIKFTITAMLAIFFVYLCYAAYKRQRLTKSIIWMLLGALSVILPFVAYFLVIGNFGIFIEEYFLRTFVTVGNTQGYTMSDTLLKFLQPNVFTYFFILFLSVLLFARWNRLSNIKKFFPLISFIWFTLITCQNAWNYYFNSLSVFGLFGLVVIAAYCEKRCGGARVLLIVPLLLMLIIIPPIKLVPTKRDSFLKYNKYKSDQFDKFANFIKSKHQPLILYLGTFPTGVGISAEALPACRYFHEQTGQAKDMTDIQLTAIKKKIPDFIVVRKGNVSHIQALKDAGYIEKNLSYSNTTLFYKQ